ncbi:MAG: hypothetical protein H8E64_09490 [Candidatus Marinimicrobia bacterium]|nr:hypothetical protein [Candidatus Neomarinimicrobiota bacterium]
MKISLKTRFGLWLDRIINKQPTNEIPGKVSASGEGVQSVLFILPEMEEHMRIAEYFIKSVSVTGKTMVVLCRDEHQSLVSPWLKKFLVIYSETDLNRWDLPTKDFVEKFTNAFEAVVDMSPAFQPIAASIVRQSNAPLRIGFDIKHADYYYNVTLKKEKATSLEKTYINIQHLLGL